MRATQVLLEKYEEIRSSGLCGSSISTSSCGQSFPDSPPTDRQLYLELRQELDRALGLAAATTKARGSALDSAGTGVAGAVASASVSCAVPSFPALANNVGSSLHGAPIASGGDAVIHGQQDHPSLAARPTSILVVDDSHISCKLAKRALAQLNFRAEVGGEDDQRKKEKRAGFVRMVHTMILYFCTMILSILLQ